MAKIVARLSPKENTITEPVPLPPPHLGPLWMYLVDLVGKLAEPLEPFRAVTAFTQSIGPGKGSKYCPEWKERRDRR